MNPQMQQHPSREQVTAHLKSLIAQRLLSLGFMEKQRHARKLRFDVAVLDLQAVPLRQREVHSGVVVAGLPNTEARRRAELVFEAEQLEYEAATGQLDMMIEGTKQEIAQYEGALKNADSNIVMPGQVGVVM